MRPQLLSGSRYWNGCALNMKSRVGTGSAATSCFTPARRPRAAFQTQTLSADDYGGVPGFEHRYPFYARPFLAR